MLLRNLVDPEPKGHKRAARKNLYVLALNEDGTPANNQVVPIPTLPLLLPDVRRSGTGLNPYLFSDKIQYSLPSDIVSMLSTNEEGLPDFKRAEYLAKSEKPARYHDAWLALIDEFLETHPTHTAAQAIKRFYTTYLKLVDFSAFAKEKVLQGANLTFTVDGQYINDNIEVQNFWVAKNASIRTSHLLEQCGICGNQASLVKFSPVALEGIPGAKAKASLVTTNSSAFESYGFGKLTTRMCADCAESWSHQINDMVKDEKVNLFNYAEKTVTMAWAQNNSIRDSVSFEAFLSSGFKHKDSTKEEAQEAITKLKSIWSGRNIPLEDIDVHFLVLKGNSGRVAVQEHWQGNLGIFGQYLEDWHARQELPDAFTKSNALQSLGKATKSSTQTGKALTKIQGLQTAVIRQAYTGMPLTRQYLPRIIRLVNKDVLIKKGEDNRQGKISPVLIQLINLMNHTPITNLDFNHPSQAYHLGRLLALADNIQQKTLGDVNKSLTATYYNKLSTYPTRAFPQLLRKMQAHIHKLQKSNMGLAIYFEKLMTECIIKSAGAPPKLSLEQQGEFACGYYAQKYHRSTKTDPQDSE
jgi:CRISPR-associated protein Csd1